MKLIDADKLKKAIDECYEYEFPTASGAFDEFAKFLVPNIIDQQPTAYDVDKVVEELNYIEMKWHKSCPPPNEYGEPMCDVDCVECQIRRCREIVKRGGVNETN